MKSVRISALMLVFAMLTACFVGGTFAKYAVEEDASVNQTVKAFGWTVTTTATEAITGDIYPGATGSVKFTVNQEPDALPAKLSAKLTMTSEPTGDGAYKPVVFTLSDKNGVVAGASKITSVLLAEKVAAITAEAGEYTISWEWPFDTDAADGANDAKDMSVTGALKFDIAFGIVQKNA